MHRPSLSLHSASSQPVRLALRAVTRCVTAFVAAGCAIVVAAPMAAADEVTVTPTRAGLPGGDILDTVINWAGQYALISLVLGGITGVAFWIWGVVGSNGGRQASGQKILVVMCGAALALGSVGMLVNLFYTAGAA